MHIAQISSRRAAVTAPSPHATSGRAVVGAVPSFQSAAPCLQQQRRLPASSSRQQLACRADTGRATSKGDSLAQLLHTALNAPDEVQWSRSTVVENREASVDGSVRTLLLSVEDHVTFLEGRKVRHVQEKKRWIDDYTSPGQFVAVRYCSHGDSTEDCTDLRAAQQLLCLASSPYEARRDSALLDASMIELLVSRSGDADERHLAELGPGSMIEVSQVAGAGFASLFSTEVNLVSSLECGHPLLMVCKGVRGIAPLRAALAWTPVLAHAGSSPVAVFYVADSQPAAAFLVEWDTWREAGVQVHPLYLEAGNGGNGGAATAEQLLEQALFKGEHGLAGVLGPHAKDAAVLMSGLKGELAAHLTRKLGQAGVGNERILFCDY